MTNNNGKNYVTLKIPKELAEQIDHILKTGTLGYRSRAELVTDATRRRIEQIHNSTITNNKNTTNTTH